MDDFEIADVSAIAWDQVLGLSRSTNDEEVLQPYKIPLEIQFDETIRIENCAAHHFFSASRIDFFQGGKKQLPLFETESSSESEDEVKQSLPVNPNPLRPSEYYYHFVAKSEQECLDELKAPQKSDEWLNARKNCITASQFGAAVGLSSYQTPDDLVNEKLWNTFDGNAATRWGNDHENHAKESFITWFEYYLKSKNGTDFQFLEENLMKFTEQPWMAVSPDGIITYKINNEVFYDLVEFKCPAYLRNTSGHPYAKHPLNTPPHYRAQTQGIMGYLNMFHPTYKFTKCWLVIWQPHQTWITLQPFDKSYFEDLYDKLRDFFFKKLLPALTHKHNGVLLHGTSIPNVPIDINT